MATKAKQTRHHDLPGTVYLNKKRYWYKVQLPGEAKPAARPLVPHGSQYATTDYSVAVNEFGPLKLIEVRDYMIHLKWSRNLINQRISRIKRMFKWAVSNQRRCIGEWEGDTVEGSKNSGLIVTLWTASHVIP